MLDLFIQEINEDQRTRDFVNPYYKGNKIKETTKSKKPKKRLKKGPQLTSRNEL